MAYVERTDEEVIAAWKEWADGHPQPDQPALLMGTGELCTPRQIAAELEAVRSESIFYKVLVTHWRKLCEELDLDPTKLIPEPKDK